LMATLSVYLNALSGRGVHVVTVNDYLARRDAEWMGRLYNFLGMSVGVVVPQQPNEEKVAAYAADITYGTNNEFGFDYLRDNMEYRAEDRRQRPLAYAIVDEVDSILIDEARTPLIISGQAEDNTELYVRMNVVPPRSEEKVPAYAADITYGTNNEFGFDYLRDNMEYRAEDRRQRPLAYAIVDEVDSILIDEARTPLIISGQAEDNTELYVRMNVVPP